MKRIVLTKNVWKPNKKAVLQRKFGILSFVLITILKSIKNILFIDSPDYSVSFSKSFLKTLFYSSQVSILYFRYLISKT